MSINITPARVSFNASGTPVSTQYDDVYFRDGQGIAETQYVFIRHNYLHDRWKSHDANTFVIAETGFGTGLNFFATCLEFVQFRQNHPDAKCRHLHFISTELYPLAHSEMCTSLASLSAINEQFTPWANAYLRQLPIAIAGCHRLNFEGVTLDLWYGHAHHSLTQIYSPTTGLVDAWYLDGFAPAKNPDMWTSALYEQIARLSKLGTSVATFTAASMVRRGLQEHGFTCQKVKGFGKKREMLTAIFTAIPQEEKPSPTASALLHDAQGITPWSRHSVATSVKHLHVVGGGIASACIALDAIRAGMSVTLHCADKQLAQGASGNLAGAIYPQLHVEPSISSRLYAHCFDYAMRYFQTLAEQVTFDHNWCGVMLLGFNESTQARFQAMTNASWPDTLIRPLSAVQSSATAGVEIPFPSMFIERGGWLNPAQTVTAMLSLAQSIGNCQIHYERRLSADDISSLASSESPVVVTLGHHSNVLQTIAPLPYRLVRGQIEYTPATPQSMSLKTVLCHKGYFTPAVEGEHVLGSTYVKNDIEQTWRETEAEANFTLHSSMLGQCKWAAGLESCNSGRAAIRCATPDHLPLMGALPNIEAQQHHYAPLSQGKTPSIEPADIEHLYILSGLGSRGLTTAPLLSAALIAQIQGQPIPLSHDLLNAVNPNRYLIRALRRGQPYPQ